jgi:hypothetical protein
VQRSGDGERDGENYMSDGKPLLPEGSPFELWDVRLMSGDLKLTVDELDAAFTEGRIDASTLVRRRGTVRWETLAKVAGLEEATTVPLAPPRPAVRPPPLPPIVAAPVVAAPEIALETTPAPLITSIDTSIDVTPPVSIEPTEQHVSSLPPPVTMPSIHEIGEETNAEIQALRPRRRRGRTFAMAFFALLVVGGGVTAWKVPSMKTRIVTALHLEKPAAPAPPPVAAAPPPPSAVPLPPPAAPPAASSAPPIKAPVTPVAPAAPVKKAGVKHGLTRHKT